MSGSVRLSNATVRSVTPNRVYASYFALQAFMGVAFWTLVAASPSVRSGFEMSAAQHAVTDSFLFADVIIGIGGSALAAVGIWREARWGTAVALFTAGGMVYATLYLVGWVAFTGHGGGLLTLMVPPSTLSAWVAHQTWRLERRSPAPDTWDQPVR